MTDIVDRLRTTVMSDVQEAATIIEQLRADNARLREALDSLETRDVHVGYDHSGNYIYEDYVSLADVRRVLAALQSQETTNGQQIRRRKPQNPELWPPSMTPSQIEDEIDRKCGCAGRHDCECVSIFNRACSDAWFKHNSEETTHDR